MSSLIAEVILVLGVALAKAADSVEGFGILTMASVGPIISVLVSFAFYIVMHF